MRVLVFHGEGCTREQIAACLGSSGADLYLTGEPEGAFALIEGYRFHLIILVLGDETEFPPDARRFLRHLHVNYPHTRIVVVSDHLHTLERDRVMQAGVTAVFGQDIAKSHLCRYVGDYLQGSSGGGARADGLGDIHELPTLESHLSRATIQAHAQPIVRLSSLEEPFEVAGCESLARGPQGTLLANPMLLFAYASQLDRLYETDMACIEAALRNAASLPSEWFYFLNVQPRSLSHPDFEEILTQLVPRHGLEPRRIVLEMTEQREVTNHALFSAELRSLKDAGYRIALDDFGEGFANLELLIAIEPHFLKLSSVLCRDIEGDPVRQAMIRSIAALSRSLKIQTVAEFIETESEARLIARLGIDHGQGYWFSRPRPLAELAESGRFQTGRQVSDDKAVA